MVTWRSPWLRRGLSVATMTLAMVGVLVVVLPAGAAVSVIGVITGYDGKCVSVAGGNAVAGTPVELSTCDGTDGQQWTLTPDGTVRALGKCLAVVGSPTIDKMTVELAECDGARVGQWLHDSRDRLVHPATGTCLDGRGSGSADRIRLRVRACGSAASQRWATAGRSVTSRRTVVHYQVGLPGAYLSPQTLVANSTKVTDVVVGTFDLTSPTGVRLAGTDPDDEKFRTLWTDLEALQGAGVRILGSVGGLAKGSYRNLDAEFGIYYPFLKQTISTHHLDGIDLDVQEQYPLASLERLITYLRADFGPSFVITVTAGASALAGGAYLSGLDYEQLYRNQGENIAWFNARFFDGWGSMASVAGYTGIVERGLIPPQKLVAQVLTNPANGASGFVDLTTLDTVTRSLAGQYQDFGGIGGWEYHNTVPGGTATPWQWVGDVSAAVGR